MKQKTSDNLIRIIKSVINKTDVEIDKDVDFEELYKLAKFHDLQNFLYYGLIKTDVSFKTKLTKVNQRAIYKEAIQEAEKELILSMFENSHIKCMILKGSIIKNLYSSQDMRSMADLDILVDVTKLKKIKKIMIALGYKCVSRGGNHDIYHKHPFMNVEIHRAMIDEIYQFSKYYKDIWNRVQLISGTNFQYQLTDNDFYIYHITHCAKHYAQGGTGIRSIIDVWVYLQHKDNELDWEYIDNQFKILGILDYADNLKQLALIWFGGHPSQEIYDKMGNYIINSGTYGTSINSSIVRGFLGDEINLNTSKTKYFITRIFPSFKIIKRRNPILKKLPFLLPWFWFTRLVSGYVFKNKQMKNEITSLKNLDHETINEIKEIHERTGV